MCSSLPPPLPGTTAVLVAAIAAVTDLRARTVPNRLTLPAAALGCLWWPLSSDPAALAACAASASATFAACWAVWRAGGWGGGDAKLVTALGCLLPLAAAPRGTTPFAAAFFGWLALCLAVHRAALWTGRRLGWRIAVHREKNAGRPLAPLVLAALLLHVAVPAPWAAGWS